MTIRAVTLNGSSPADALFQLHQFRHILGAVDNPAHITIVAQDWCVDDLPPALLTGTHLALHIKADRGWPPPYEVTAQLGRL